MATAYFTDKPLHHHAYVMPAVVNALSEWLDLKIWRQGQEWTMRFRNGEPEAPLKATGKSDATCT